jgi:RNA recognition motif-containing protein
MEHGSLEKCRIDQDDFGRSMTTATVLFRSEDGARNAIQKLNKSKILNSVITVEYFRWDRDDNRSHPAIPRTKPIQKNFKKRFDRR